MNKSFLLSKIKPLFVFTLASILGLWLGGFFDRYVFNFEFSESFSKAEATSLIGKRVFNACQPPPDSEIAGKITGFTEEKFGDIYINIVWEKTNDKLYPTGFYKGSFNQCIEFTGEN